MCVVISPPHGRMSAMAGLMFMHAHAAASAASLFKETDTTVLTGISSSDTLDPFSQGKVDLWHAASLELSIGPEADDPFVQAAVHAILEWLRGEANTPRALLETFGRPRQVGDERLPEVHPDWLPDAASGWDSTSAGPKGRRGSNPLPGTRTWGSFSLVGMDTGAVKARVLG